MANLQVRLFVAQFSCNFTNFNLIFVLCEKCKIETVNYLYFCSMKNVQDRSY